MRKLIGFIASALVAGALVAGPAVAEPSAKCNGAPAATGTDGSMSISVCVSGVGALTAAQKGNGGYVVADGDTANSTINPCLDGFVGIQVTEAGPGYAASGEGDYSYPHTQGEPNPTECAPA
ncbi:MAG TPA: hypothetical protein VM840_03730 [Actinomycetota bacterium]|nr:hypothetical protein [Actinomycetota bacterium]